MAKTKVLIVEDYRPLAESLEYQLTRAGYEVFRAADGGDALTQAKLRLPDVVFLDVDLPVLNGIDVCKQLRAYPETRETLILMLSALGEESDQVIGFAVGADDYVVKPVESYAVLLQRLKALLRRREPSVEAVDQLATIESTSRLSNQCIKQPKLAFRDLQRLAADFNTIPATIDGYTTCGNRVDGFNRWFSAA